ncbi:MAG TPA: hypothetical protein VEX66_15555, partial [Microlunatus sp.]|nr:hypothetical protein [Microlunatus sp.]
MIERIADILQLDGDPDPVDQRRAKAAGWLARPEDLVVLLYRHRHDGITGPADDTTSTGSAAAAETDFGSNAADPASGSSTNSAGDRSGDGPGRASASRADDRSGNPDHPGTDRQHQPTTRDDIHGTDGHSETTDPAASPGNPVSPPGDPYDPVPQPPPDFPGTRLEPR